MVDPTILCRNHLLGEHVEIHMFIGSCIKGISLNGYVDNNLLEFKSMYFRHNELVKEMTNRGMNHKSDLPKLPIKLNYPSYILESKIDKESALNDLISRCDECRNNHKRILLL